MVPTPSVNTSEQSVINTLETTADRQKVIAKLLSDIESITKECKLVKTGLKKIIRKGK